MKPFNWVCRMWWTSGTARVARIRGYFHVAGKTGTAENYGIINGKREKLEDHSWFVCFAPRENPR